MGEPGELDLRGLERGPCLADLPLDPPDVRRGVVTWTEGCPRDRGGWQGTQAWTPGVAGQDRDAGPNPAPPAVAVGRAD